MMYTTRESSNLENLSRTLVSNIIDTCTRVGQRYIPVAGTVIGATVGIVFSVLVIVVVTLAGIAVGLFKRVIHKCFFRRNLK